MLNLHKIAVHIPHGSGIGTVFIGYQDIATSPEVLFDRGECWYDETNREFAMWQ